MMSKMPWHLHYPSSDVCWWVGWCRSSLRLPPSNVMCPLWWWPCCGCACGASWWSGAYSSARHPCLLNFFILRCSLQLESYVFLITAFPTYTHIMEWKKDIFYTLTWEHLFKYACAEYFLRKLFLYC